MFGKTASIIVAALLVISTLALAYDIQPVRADELVFIKADGSIDPSTANITTSDNMTYTFTGNITGELITVLRPNIVIDGNGNTVRGSGSGNGFTLPVNNVTIKNMNIADFNTGISIQDSNYIFVSEDNIAYCSGFGVYETSSNDCTVSASNVTGCSTALFLDLSNCTVLSDNNVSDNTHGIFISNSFDNTIIGNTVSGHNGPGIDILDSLDDNTINGNTVSGNNGTGIVIQHSSSGSSSSDVMEGNTVIGNYGDGIFISNSSSILINNSTVYNNNNGIWLDHCPNALVNSSIISGNQRKGIYLGNSDSENVTNNQISFNSEIGVYLYYSDKGIVQDNRIENNTVGIYMIWVHEYLLLDNDVVNQSSCGIYMTGYSTSNTAYHNNFVDNAKQVKSDMNSHASWSNGYPSGGNYWSDYTGNDTKKGPNQDMLGQDGIGDTPKFIDGYNTDTYPLSPSTQPSHDIGIFNPQQWKTVVFQGYPLCTYGSIINYGNNDENISIISYANSAPFDSKNSTLQARTWNATGFTFGWNTTGLLTYVPYSLSFYAVRVAGETDTSDNNFTGGWVIVTRVGDLNYDNKCDGLDIVRVARAYGSYGPNYYYPGSPATARWNPDADIDNDNQNDGLDIVIVARHFGEGTQ